jgi:hypothetical protein
MLWGGAATAAVLGAYVVSAGTSPDMSEVPQVEAEASPPSPQTLLPAPTTPRDPAPGAAASAEGLVLYGISGGGSAGMAALIGPASGYPRIVRAGMDYRPGLTLTEIGATHAVLVSAGQETTLQLGGVPKTEIETPRVASAPPAAAPQAGPQGMDTVALRLGMKPRKTDGRTTGFELKQSRGLPLLQKAGLQQGDVIVAVNGQAFASEEKLMELPQEIAGSNIAEFEIERGGKRMKLSLTVNRSSN